MLKKNSKKETRTYLQSVRHDNDAINALKNIVLPDSSKAIVVLLNPVRMVLFYSEASYRITDIYFEDDGVFGHIPQDLLPIIRFGGLSDGETIMPYGNCNQYLSAHQKLELYGQLNAATNGSYPLVAKNRNMQNISVSRLGEFLLFMQDKLFLGAAISGTDVERYVRVNFEKAASFFHSQMPSLDQIMNVLKDLGYTSIQWRLDGGGDNGTVEIENAEKNHKFIDISQGLPEDGLFIHFVKFGPIDLYTGIMHILVDVLPDIDWCNNEGGCGTISLFPDREEFEVDLIQNDEYDSDYEYGEEEKYDENENLIK